MSSEYGPSASRLLGTILLVIGALWMALSGACTVVFAWLGLGMARGDFRQFLSVLPLALGVGAISILIGWLIWRVGKFLRRPQV